MNYKLKLLALSLLLCISTIMAGEITWNGSEDNDFFNEKNWTTTSGASPASGTLDPNKGINDNLIISNFTQDIVARGIISLGSQSLSVTNATLNGSVISDGTLAIGKDGYVSMDASEPLTGSSVVNFLKDAGWLKMSELDPKLAHSSYLHRIKINGASARNEANLRIDNYYTNGCLLRPIDEDLTPLTIYSEMNQTGTSANITTNTIHSGTSIPNSLNDNISSFKLKRGFMVVMADVVNGTGISKTYIASEKDLEVNELPDNLKDAVSFIRVLPWNWVSKKGIGGKKTGFNETWFYYWWNSGESSIDAEYAPMAWSGRLADSDADIAKYIAKYKATHVMGFNEADDCHAQSGAVDNLCQVDVAVPIYKNLMKTGMRMVSPNCRENAPFGWLWDFYQEATAQNIRIDVIGVHWYDWGSNPKNSPNEDPQKAFNRFKNYLQRVYDQYQLPIWISEFNANPNRTKEVNTAFMKLALPYLEELEYVERYAWFEPSSGSGDYYEEDGSTLTEVGNYYKNMHSTPSVTEDFLICPSNLDNNTNEKFEYFDGFESYDNDERLDEIYTVVEGVATAVDVDKNTEFGTAYAGNKFGKTDDNKNNFEFSKTFELEAGKTYVWDLSTRISYGLQHVMSVKPVSVYPTLNCYNKEWEKHSIEFTVEDGNEQVTLSLYRYFPKEMFFDDFWLREKEAGTSIPEVTLGESQQVITPNPSCNYINISNIAIGTPVTFFTLQGVLVYDTIYHDNLDISSLDVGIYLVRTPTEVLKFVKG